MSDQRKHAGPSIRRVRPSTVGTPIRNTVECNTLGSKLTAKQEHKLSQQHIKATGMAADSDTMLKTMMPVHDAIIDRLFEHCVAQKLYDETTSRWVYMPTSTSSPEKTMYEPIRAIGQCIHDAIQDTQSEAALTINGLSLKKVQHGDDDKVMTVKGIWNVLPNRPPRTGDPLAADTRPDIDFAIPSQERAALKAEIKNYLSDLEAVRSFLVSSVYLAWD